MIETIGTLIIIQLPLTTIMTNIPAPSKEPIAMVAVLSSSAVNAAFMELFVVSN